MNRPPTNSMVKWTLDPYSLPWRISHYWYSPREVDWSYKAYLVGPYGATAYAWPEDLRLIDT